MDEKNIVNLKIELVEPPYIFDYYDTLAVAGGGIKGLCILGSLQYLYDNNIIDKINNYVGTSVGTILCYLMIIGYSPIDIIAYICTNKITEKLSSFDITSMINGGGAVSFTPIHTELEKMTIEKVGTLFTMKDFYNTFKKNLVCVTYNLTESKKEYISYLNYPDLPVLFAIRMSCNLPFVFDEFKYKNNYYIDGGIVDNFPIKYAETIGKNIIGINLHTENKNKSRTNINILEYFYQLFTIPINENINDYRQGNQTKVIKLGLSNMKPFNFSITTPQKLDLFSTGYQQTSGQI